MELDAVVCVTGRPTVCVKDARQSSSADVEKLRRKLWNLGAATLLVVERDTSVEVYSLLKKPEETDGEGKKALLTEEALNCLDAASLALDLQRFIRRVETGAIYSGGNESLFLQNDAVDRYLLSNLKETRNELCPSSKKEKKDKLEYHRAHALIGRFLFTCYLFDRKIIDENYLAKKKLPQAADMRGFLEKSLANREKNLKELFGFLQNDFNGSLFGDAFDADSITSREIDLLLHFVSGDDMKSKQSILPNFKFYDFSFIPVELISSIYEEFLATEAKLENDTKLENETILENEGKPQNKQRAEGAYYTPPRLAELTIDIATKGWDTLLDKRCFDPACGSGIFLVILFIRMAEEWRTRNPKADTQQRYDEMCRILSENICGGDINKTACLVSCFSLYLALLDQMEPKAIIELKTALEIKGKQKILPPLLWEKDEPKPQASCLGTIREIDFFNFPVEKDYDLVIGNPPWVSRTKGKSKSPNPTTNNIENWLFKSNPKPLNPYLDGVTKSEWKTSFLPAGEFACAFMWKAGLHLKPGGKVCQILPSRVFIANQTNRFQAQWLQHHRLETVWLLADWSFILFQSADCPCFIARYHLHAEGENFGTFDFVTPKVESIDPREALLPVLPDDQKELLQRDILDAAQKGEAAYAWKKNHWGTPRDLRLLDRLMRFPRLESIIKEPPKDTVPFEQRHHDWYASQGFRPATKSTTKPKDVRWNPDEKFIDARKSHLNLLLLQSDCETTNEKLRDNRRDASKDPLLRAHEKGLDKDPSLCVYQAPLLLVNKGCSKFLFSNFNVLFTDAFQSICAPKSDEDKLLFLTAYFSSQLGQYLFFHATANIGIERDISRLEEFFKVPFPFPEHTHNPEKSQKIINECVDVFHELRRQLDVNNFWQRDALVLEAQNKLNELVYKYFNICEWERVLIEDTVNIFRPSSTPGALNGKKLFTTKTSKKQNREQYADTLIRTFQGWARNTKKQISTQGMIASRIGMVVVTMIVDDTKRKYEELPADTKVEALLEKIRGSLSGEPTTLFDPLRGLIFFEENRVHILKPISRRNWTRTAALNDADTILARMMKEEGWA